MKKKIFFFTISLLDLTDETKQHGICKEKEPQQKEQSAAIWTKSPCFCWQSLKQNTLHSPHICNQKIPFIYKNKKSCWRNLTAVCATNIVILISMVLLILNNGICKTDKQLYHTQYCFVELLYKQIITIIRLKRPHMLLRL